MRQDVLHRFHIHALQRHVELILLAREASVQRPPQTIDEDEPINIAIPNQPQTSPAVSQYPGMPTAPMPAGIRLTAP